jgi:hypothetical protein
MVVPAALAASVRTPSSLMMKLPHSSPACAPARVAVIVNVAPPTAAATMVYRAAVGSGGVCPKSAGNAEENALVSVRIRCCHCAASISAAFASDRCPRWMYAE